MLLDLWPIAAGARSHRRTGTGIAEFVGSGPAATGFVRTGRGTVEFVGSGPGRLPPPVPYLLVPAELMAITHRRRGVGIVELVGRGTVETAVDPLFAAVSRRRADDEEFLLLLV